jgi:hypothetical protein
MIDTIASFVIYCVIFVKNIGDNDLAKFNKDDVDAYKLYAETIWITDNAPVSVNSFYINYTQISKSLI